ncbi:inovirus-type Gp2 protein [Shewanella sp. S1-58-MNA-CIBAN-0166]|uniref:YagK/YfjJ domain-containing protein n=1 Tax=Shewanella sp. S1-58-MNA-CIBAN-0166 TaxID=3140467 RepID=UPI003318F24A
MHISIADFYSYKGNQWKVNNRPSGCYTPILKSSFEQIFNFQSHHLKLMAIRYDLHQPSYVLLNKQITVFFRRLSKQLKAKYKIHRLGYIWVREQEKAKSPHYHIVLLLDGKNIMYPGWVNIISKRIWSELGGFIYYPRHQYYKIQRGDNKNMARLLYRVSYFAKARGKRKKPPQTKNYGTSRIEFNPKPTNKRFTGYY